MSDLNTEFPEVRPASTGVAISINVFYVTGTVITAVAADLETWVIVLIGTVSLLLGGVSSTALVLYSRRNRDAIRERQSLLDDQTRIIEGQRQEIIRIETVAAQQTSQAVESVRAHLESLRGALRVALRTPAEVSEALDQLLILAHDGRDRLILQYSTEPISEQRCEWRRVRFVSTGADAGSVEASVQGGGCRLLEIRRDSNEWEGLVLFDPPIAANESRSWTLTLVWPQFADELRRSRVDSFFYYTDVESPVGTLRVMYPPSWTEKYGAAPRGFHSLSPSAGTWVTKSEDGAVTLEWTIPEPQRGQTYNAELLAAERPHS